MTIPRQSIRQATPATQVSQPQVEFRMDDYHAIIGSKGYDIFIEKAIRCPCEGDSGSPLSTCQNCMGTGFIFINPLKTKAIASGINQSSQYKDWSLERAGTISLTVRDDDKETLAFYDKITFADKFSTFSEVLKVRAATIEGQSVNFIFSTYKIKNIVDAFLFVDSETPLVKLTSNQIQINPANPYVAILNVTLPIDNNGSLSLRYKHEIQYNVIDMPHELRGSTIVDNDGKRKNIILPMNAIARRSHLTVAEKPNFDGTGWINNSYL